MIDILGVKDGKEFEAAAHLRKQILAVWPDLAQSSDDHVRIFVGLKLYGYRIEDIDLVVIGHFSRPRAFDVEYKFYPKDGEPFIPRRPRRNNDTTRSLRSRRSQRKTQTKRPPANPARFNPRAMS